MTEEMSFLEHLGELRKRVISAAIGIGVGFLLVYTFAEEVFGWLMKPLCAAFGNYECRLITIGVAEAFLVYLKTGLIGGVFLSIPWVFFQVWKFISPGLKPSERKYIIPFVFFASLMFIGGAGFGYFYIFPFAFEFFLSMSSDSIVPMPAMSAYFSFTASLLFAFGALFEIPVLVVLLNFIGVVEAKSLWRTWRYAVVGIFVLSAVLTPADPFTMLLLGTPLSVLYLGSLGICSFMEKARRKRSPIQQQ